MSISGWLSQYLSSKSKTTSVSDNKIRASKKKTNQQILKENKSKSATDKKIRETKKKNNQEILKSSKSSSGSSSSSSKSSNSNSSSSKSSGGSGSSGSSGSGSSGSSGSTSKTSSTTGQVIIEDVTAEALKTKKAIPENKSNSYKPFWSETDTEEEYRMTDNTPEYRIFISYEQLGGKGVQDNLTEDKEEETILEDT